MLGLRRRRNRSAFQLFLPDIGRKRLHWTAEDTSYSPRGCFQTYYASREQDGTSSPQAGLCYSSCIAPTALILPSSWDYDCFLSWSAAHSISFYKSYLALLTWPVSSDQSTRKGLQPSWPWSILRLVHISGQRLYFGKSACPVFELGIAASADTGMTSL